jgi:hypothetical protein
MKSFAVFLFCFMLVACVTDYTDPLNVNGSESDAKELGGSGVDAVLVKPDIAACVCCGGYILEVKGLLFNFENFPTSAPEDLKKLEYPGQYPVPVKVEFEFSRTCGEKTYVSVSSIRTR